MTGETTLRGRVTAIGGVKEKVLAAKRAGVQKEGFVHGDYEGNEMQLPAFFHVQPDLTVVEAHYGQHIADIPTIDEMLAKI